MAGLGLADTGARGKLTSRFAAGPMAAAAGQEVEVWMKVVAVVAVGV